VISIWEEANSEAQKTYGDNGYVIKSISLYLVGNDPHDAEMVWEPNVEALGPGS